MKRARTVVKGQVGPRRKYHALTDEDDCRLDNVVRMLWDLMLDVRLRSEGYDAMTLEVIWVYQNGAQHKTNVGFVIVEYGNSFWRIWRHIEVKIAGFAGLKRENGTIQELCQDLFQIARFWAVLVGVQVVRKKLNGLLGLDGQLIMYEHVQVEELSMATQFEYRVPYYTYPICVECRMSLAKIQRILEARVVARQKYVVTLIRDLGMDVDVAMDEAVFGGVENEQLRVGVLKELNAFKQDWFEAPVRYLNSLASSEVTRYHGFVGVTEKNTGSGPKNDMVSML